VCHTSTTTVPRSYDFDLALYCLNEANKGGRGTSKTAARIHVGPEHNKATRAHRTIACVVMEFLLEGGVTRRLPIHAEYSRQGEGYA